MLFLLLIITSESLKKVITRWLKPFVGNVSSKPFRLDREKKPYPECPDRRVDTETSTMAPEGSLLHSSSEKEKWGTWWRDISELAIKTRLPLLKRISSLMSNVSVEESWWIYCWHPRGTSTDISLSSYTSGLYLPQEKSVAIQHWGQINRLWERKIRI